MTGKIKNPTRRGRSDTLTRMQGLGELARTLSGLEKSEGEEHLVWLDVETIVECMSGQPGRDSVFFESEKKIYDGSVATLLRLLPEPFAVWDIRDKEKAIRKHKFQDLAVNIFNRLASRYPPRVKLLVNKRGEVFRRYQEVQTAGERAVILLWSCYFEREGWKRLRRCPQCVRWFVAANKNRNKQFCSPGCKSKFWSRERRGTKKKPRELRSTP